MFIREIQNPLVRSVVLFIHLSLLLLVVISQRTGVMQGRTVREIRMFSRGIGYNASY